MASTISSGVNTSTFSVGSDGKLNVSGISSGIDSKAIIDALVAARRQPAVQLETKVTTNSSKISALSDFKTKVATMTTALDKLRGNPGSTTNVFNTKSVSGSTTAASGTASSIDSLLVVTVDSTAQNMTHTIKINTLAEANQVRSDAISSTSTALSTLGITPGSMTVGGKTITVSSSDTLLDLKSKINNAGAGVSASIVSANSTTNYLVLTSEDTGTANAMTFGGDATLTDTLGLTQTSGTVIKNQLVAAADANIDVDGVTGITRSSNSINDVVSGVTLSLLKSEVGTTITLKVEPDLTTIKTALSDFVTAYNDIRSYVTDQRTASDRNKDGTVGDSEYGPLAYDQTVRDTLDKLGQMAAGSVDGAADGYASLGQVGIVMKSDYTLSLDDTVLDSKLLTNVDGFRNLFSLETSVSDSRVTVLSRGTATASGTYTLNITGTDASGNVTGATLNGVAMTVSGKTLTAADGTSLFFNGGASLGAVSGITVDLSRGLADQYYDGFNTTTKDSSGTIDTLITQLQTQNQDYNDRVDVIDGRLTTYRSALEAKYTAMEVAMAKLATLQQTIQSYSDSLNSSSN
jgi:flagellar hook-associated protein 2